MKKVWLCGFCLFLLAVGCTGTNSGSSETKKDSRTDTPKEVTSSSTNDALKGELYDRIEQISRAAQGITTALQNYPNKKIMNKFSYIVGATTEVQQGLIVWQRKIREYLGFYYQGDKENAKNTLIKKGN